MEVSEDEQHIKYEWQDVVEAQMSDAGDEDLQFLESLVFGNGEMNYNALDADTAAFVSEAINGNQESREHPESDDKNIQCINCGLLFTTQTFKLHVCTHDKFQEPVAVIPKDSEILKLTRHIQSVMIQNGERSKAMQKDKRTLECKRCSRTFSTASALQRHYDYHIGEILEPAPLEDTKKLINLTLCVFCGQVFAKEEDAWNHLVSSHVDVHDEDSGEDSGIIHDVESDDAACSETPAKKLKLDENNNKATTSKSPPQTPIAAPNEPPKKSSAAIALDLIKSVNLSKVYQCDFCDYIFACEKLMLRHVADHAPSSGYDCKSCELVDLTLKDILLHRRDECVVFRDIRNPLRDFARVWVCNVCSEEFRGVEQLVEHRHSNHHFYPRIEPRTNQLVFGCELCSGQFATAPVVTAHFSEKHLNSQRADLLPPTTSNRTARSASKGRGGQHQTSTRPREFLCDVCGKSYTQSSHLWQHLRFHRGVKPFACNVEGCDRRFTIRPDLNDHIRKCHTGERPYLCTICDKRFLTGSVYYQHRLIHRGERRYGCSECSKRFYRADALKNHERIHTGEKPFACKICFKAFRQRGDRDKHLKSRHPGVVFEASPKRARVKSYGRGHVANNTSLYQNWPNPKAVPSST